VGEEVKCVKVMISKGRLIHAVSKFIFIQAQTKNIFYLLPLANDLFVVFQNYLHGGKVLSV
jgi:hypothetical protein